MRNSALFRDITKEIPLTGVRRKRMTLAQEQIAVLKEKLSAATARIKELESENERHRLDIQNVQLKKGNIEKQLANNLDGNPFGFFCDHCSSPQLKRIGNRPHPIFGDVGTIEAVYNCTACGKESAFIQ
jgi:hypothetical protein